MARTSGAADIAKAIREHEIITVELLYTDQAGAQRTISRFMITPVDSQDDTDSRGSHR